MRGGLNRVAAVVQCRCLNHDFLTDEALSPQAVLKRNAREYAGMRAQTKRKQSAKARNSESKKAGEAGEKRREISDAIGVAANAKDR